MNFLEKLNKAVWAFRHQFSPIPDYDFNSDGELVQNYIPIKWTQSALIELALSGIVGTALGVFIALIVNGALVEVSLSPPFAVYFGVLFIVMGVVVIWRTLSSNNVPLHPEEAAAIRTPRRHLIFFGALNIVTGVFCFLLERDTLLLLAPWLRVLTYTFLGMSLSFALTYGIVDLLNLTFGFFRPEFARPLVESVLQIYVVVVASLAMGALFGCLFGAVDVSRLANPIAGVTDVANLSEEKGGLFLANMVDLRLCLPIGGLWGALAGLANEYIRRVELAFNRLDQPVEFEADI